MTIPADRVQRAFSTERDMVDFLWPAGIAPKRGLIQHVQKSRIDAARNLVDDTSNQAIFPAADDAFTVVAGQQYRFLLAGRFVKGVNSVSLRLVFGGTATFTTCNYVAIGGTGASGTAVAPGMNNGEAATVTDIVLAGTGVNARTLVVGEFEINAGGTIIPQVSWSGATGATPAVSVGTFFEMWPEGANPVTSIGNVA